MKTLFETIACTVLFAITLSACAHSRSEKKLDDKLTQETAVNTNADLREEATDTIESSRGLSDDQKIKLLSLRDSTRQQADDYHIRSLRLRAILVKDLVSSDYDAVEVDLIKKRIADLEQKRTSALVNAVEQANAILGHQAPAHSAMIHEFFMDTRGSKNR